MLALLLFRRHQTTDISLFGAIANDSIDDTAAINRALIVASNKGNGTVMCPPGNYIITSINVPSNAHLIMRGAIFKLVDNGLDGLKLPHLDKTWLPPGFMIKDTSHVVLDGGTIDGNCNAAHPREKHRGGVFIYDSTDVTIKNMEVKNVEGRGIITNSSSPDFNYERPDKAMFKTKCINIAGCYVHDTYSRWHPGDIKAGILSYVKGYGIEINRTNKATITDCVVKNGEESLFRSENSEHIRFTGCYGNHTTYYGEPFDVLKNYDLIISDCHAACNYDPVRHAGYGFAVYENNTVKLLNSTADVNGVVLKIRPTKAKNRLDNIEVKGCMLKGECRIILKHASHIKIDNNKIFGLLNSSRFDSSELNDVVGFEVTKNDIYN